MPLRLPAALAAVLLLTAAAVAARAAGFTDAAGRYVELPEHVARILPAERNAEVMVFALAPEKLVGSDGAARRGRRLGWRLRGNPATFAATALQLRADLIIDAGTATPDRAAFADEVMRQTGIPYVLVDDSFARIPRSMRAIGAIIGADARHVRDLWRYAEHAVAALHGQLLIVPPSARPRVYYARGSNGLTTALPGSPAAEAIAEAGAINVAAPLGQGAEVTITPAQLLAWDPSVIIADNPRAYNAMRRNRLWRGLLAVRNRRVYLEPTYPFGWIEDPAGINRLIGLYWLSTLLYPEALREDLRGTTCEFYDKFYRIRLKTARLERMLRAAGIRPPETAQPLGEPLPGLSGLPLAAGAAPPPLGATPPAAGPRAPGPSGIAPPTLDELPLGQPPVPSTAANADCTLPGNAAGPLDLTNPTGGLPGMPGALPEMAPPALPGVPPPGRRGHPSSPAG
ncbi:MAG: ABC transporter substrate-binding protein [Thiohalocapsa sp.]